MKKSIRMRIVDCRSDQAIDVNWAPEKRSGSVARKCAKLFGHPVVGADWRLKNQGRVYSSDVVMGELPVRLLNYTIQEIGHGV